VAALAVVCALQGCGRSERRGVLISILSPAEQERPDGIDLSWLDADGKFLFRDQAIPVVGRDAELATVFVELPLDASGGRWALARGRSGASVISEGVASVVLDGSTRLEVALRLRPGRLPDRDRDGVPDGISDATAPMAPRPASRDAAPAASDAALSAPVPVRADAGSASPLDDRGPPAGPDATVGSRDLGAAVSSRGRALLVLRDAKMARVAEQAIEGRLAELGFEVVVRDDRGVTLADAMAAGVVILPPSTDENLLGERLRGASVGVLCMDGNTWPRLGMVAGGFGRTMGQTALDVVLPGHPLAAGLMGRVTVTSQPELYWWATLPPGATQIASLSGDAAKAAIFAFEKGAQMPGGPAPARRVAFFTNEDAFPVLSTDGRALFDAAVLWAAGR
jgi:hypothetical protein